MSAWGLGLPWGHRRGCSSLGIASVLGSSNVYRRCVLELREGGVWVPVGQGRGSPRGCWPFRGLALDDCWCVVKWVEGCRQWPALGRSGCGFGVSNHFPIDDSQWDVGGAGVALRVEMLVGGESMEGTFIVPTPMGDGILEGEELQELNEHWVNVSCVVLESPLLWRHVGPAHHAPFLFC